MSIRKITNWLYKKYSFFVHSFILNQSGFYKDTRWIRRTHFFFGMMPIYEMENGRIGYKYFSFYMLYSVIVYSVLSIFCFKMIVIKRLYKLLTLLNDFDDFIFNLMFILFVKSQFFYAVGGWFTMKDMALYHNLWKDFEVLYQKKLKKPLFLKSVEKVSNRFVILGVSCTLCLSIGQLFTLPTYTVQECVGYLPSCSCTFFYIGIVFINCYALEQAGAVILKDLKNDLNRNPVTQDLIILHRTLWNSLSNVAQQLGTAFFCYNFVIFTSSLIDLITCGYGYLSRLLIKIKTDVNFTTISPEELGLIVATVCTMYILVQICHCYHHATDNLTTPFVDELCVATTRYHHPKVNKEIELFLMSIKSNLPVITLGGYVDIDKSLITKVISLVTTYYIVLLQFKMSFNG